MVRDYFNLIVNLIKMGNLRALADTNHRPAEVGRDLWRSEVGRDLWRSWHRSPWLREGEAGAGCPGLRALRF